MELVYTHKGLDCPQCSAKIEREVGEIEHVTKAVVDLMHQTLTVRTEHAIAEELSSAVERIVHRHEPDIEIIAHEHEHHHEHEAEHDHDHCGCGHEHAHEQEHEHHHEHEAEHDHEHCACGHEHAHEAEHAHQHAHAEEHALLFTLKGLDCPYCSAKIEHDVAALPAVEAASVNLMQQTLAVHAPAADRDQLIAAVTEIVHKHEPDVEVIAQTAQEKSEKKIRFSGEAGHEMEVLEAAVTRILTLSVDSFIKGDVETAYTVEPLEEWIDVLCDTMKLNHVERLQSGVCSMTQGFVFNDLLGDFERVATSRL